MGLPIPYLELEQKPENTRHMFDMRDYLSEQVAAYAPHFQVRMHMNLAGPATVTYFLRDIRTKPGLIYELCLDGKNGLATQTWIITPPLPPKITIEPYVSEEHVLEQLLQVARRYRYVA